MIFKAPSKRIDSSDSSSSIKIGGDIPSKEESNKPIPDKNVKKRSHEISVSELDEPSKKDIDMIKNKLFQGIGQQIK